ncbi:uncharacterized protein [Amphiura filiformis]|uniref:uncharacterized protein n=1 Tax=Amphiura filiformis TaxID=82378 RepID=UPI003B220111
MHRSHWVAKPQQSTSIVRKGILIPPSESEIQAFPVPPLRKRRDRSRESPSRRTQLSSSSSSLSNSSAESEDVHIIASSKSSGCTDLDTSTSPTANDTQKPKETCTKVLRPLVPSICVDYSDDTAIDHSESSTPQEEIKPIDSTDVLSTELISSKSAPETTLAIVSPTENDSSDNATRSTNVPRFTATCTSTVTVLVTPSSDDNQTDKPKRRGSPPVILAAIACDDDSGNQIDEIVLPYRRPVHSISSPQVTQEEPPKSTDGSKPDEGPPSVVSSEEIHLARQDSLGVPPVFVGEVSFPGPVDNRPPPPPYSVAIKDVTPRLTISEDTNINSQLDVPLVPTGEISFPPLREPSDELARLEQIERNRERVISEDWVIRKCAQEVLIYQL